MKNISLQNVEELRLRNEELQNKIVRLSTVSGVEEEIRSKFSVAKEGENVVLVIDNKNDNASTTTTKKEFWTFISKFFEHKK